MSHGRGVGVSGDDRLLSPPHRRLSIAVYTTVALIAFEGTSVAAAIPDVAADLGDVGSIPWIITGFLVMLGLSTVVAGPVVDAVGARPLFVTSTVVFAGSGFVAGLMNDVTLLILVRLVQGASSGFLFAATIAAVNLGFPDSLTGRAFAANSNVWGVMGAAAPAIAAVILDIASWRWLFFINLPLGALALFAGRRALPERVDEADPLRLDWLGVTLVAVFTLTGIVAVDELGSRSLVLGAACLVAGLVYVRHARRVERPVLSLRHIAVQPFAGLAMAPALMVTAGFAINIYVTLYVAAGRGWSPGAAAGSVVFFTVGWTVGANMSARLLDVRTPVQVMTYGFAASLGGHVVAMAGAYEVGPLAVVFVGLALVGLGIGMTSNASLIELRAATPPTAIGRASAANQFARSQGFAVGAAAGGAVLLAVVDRQLGSVEVVRSLLAGDLEGGASIGSAGSAWEPGSAAIAQAVRDGFAAVSVMSLVVVALAWLPLRRLRRHVEPHRMC